ncbi:hypothetical protein [Pseudanabaena sp. FACHB-2040]|uniref:hypothetical protein n=1 Tax=Pseudanabaena sp. FACHB-2040 TaxID=2692859 RepID=UPI0016850032|nr:hypothetical protein [Pseudanabaena sp. FACHB-2040]MBD2259325.1 hypothetical protein [Pseudanabaena sp. FACHB-2040]
MLNNLKRIAPAIGLFLLSPLIAEFLLGNISIDLLLTAGPFVALGYGTGALLIREVTRRTNRGWRTMILLGLAYAVFLEGLVNQTLFNPSIFGLNLLDTAYIPAIGMGAWWTLMVLTLHTVWSMSVSIALVETLVPNRRTTPWLGKAGLAVTTLLFFLGAALGFVAFYFQERFLASPPQLIGSLIAIVAIVVFAFKVRPYLRSQITRRAPSPRVVGLVSLLTSSVFMASNLVVDFVPGWALVGMYLVLYILMIKLVSYWSRSQEWGNAHQLALAGGALLTYAWYGFPQLPTIGSKGVVDLIGNGIFAIGACVLLAIINRTVHQTDQRASDQSNHDSSLN